MKTTVVVFFLALVVDFIAAQPNVGFFQNPAGGTNTQNYSFNPVWRIGETQTVQWTTVFNNYSITLWQQSLTEGSATPGPAILTTLPGASSITQFPWDVSIFSFDLKNSPVFFFWLIPGAPATDTRGMTSRYFNITSAAVSANASSASIATSPSTSTPPSTTPSTTSSIPSQIASAAPATNATSLNTSSSGFSKADKIGTGFAAVGFAIIVAGIAFVIYYRKNKKRSRLEMQRSEMQRSEEIAQEYIKPELPESSARHELPHKIYEQGLPAELS